MMVFCRLLLTKFEDDREAALLNHISEYIDISIPKYFFFTTRNGSADPIELEDLLIQRLKQVFEDVIIELGFLRHPFSTLVCKL